MTSVFALKSFPWVFSLRFIFIGLLSATVTSLYFETALIFFILDFFCFECERSHDLPQRILVTIIFSFRFSQMSPVIVKYWTRRLNVPIKNVRGSENSEMSRNTERVVHFSRCSALTLVARKMCFGRISLNIWRIHVCGPSCNAPSVIIAFLNLRKSHTTMHASGSQ